MSGEIPVSEIVITERCALRYPAEKDIIHVWSATRAEGFNEGMRWEPPESIGELIEPLRKSEADWAAGTSYSWTIEDRRSGEFIGRIVIRREDADGTWSIGFWTHPAYQRRGYATEAARAVIKFGFDRLHAQVITAAHATWNEASGKVLRGAGMQFTRMNPKGFQKRGRWVEEREYEIRKSGSS